MALLEHNTAQSKAEPGLVIMLKPRVEAWAIMERAVKASTRERTAKDFIDLLENVGVLEWLCPASPGHMSADASWREFLIWKHRDLELEREIWTGCWGRAFVLLFVLDRQSRQELPRWKGLIRSMIGKFF